MNIISTSSSLLFPSIINKKNKVNNDNANTNTIEKRLIASCPNEYGYLPLHSLVSTDGNLSNLSI